MKRVVSFIDGYNLYHAICNLGLNHLKWINLWGLSEAFIKPSQEKILDVYYFTAFAEWRESSYRRHLKFVEAQKAVGVKTILGHFKEKRQRCRDCKRIYTSHEEKQTDVNIAINLLNLAYTNAFDKALIITADSDLCPVINLVMENFSGLEICILTPPNRYVIARELRNTVPTQKIKQAHIENNLLPKKVVNTKTGLVIDIPPEYKNIRTSIKKSSLVEEFEHS